MRRRTLLSFDGYGDRAIAIVTLAMEKHRIPPAEPMRKMDRYAEAGLIQVALDAVLTELYPMALAGDRVHPTLAGHVFLAGAFLKALPHQEIGRQIAAETVQRQSK